MTNNIPQPELLTKIFKQYMLPWRIEKTEGACIIIDTNGELIIYSNAADSDLFEVIVYAVNETYKLEENNDVI